jgi:hypothetical protein
MRRSHLMMETSSLISETLRAVKEPGEAANCDRKQGGTKVCHDSDSTHAFEFRIFEIVQIFHGGLSASRQFESSTAGITAC